MPVPRWAPALEEFVPPAAAPPASRAGHRRGTAHVTVTTDSDGRRHVEVVYTNFSDEPGWVLDGFERADSSGDLLGTTHYVADLALSGAHHGYLRADANISPLAFTGTMVSAVDGRVLQLP